MVLKINARMKTMHRYPLIALTLASTLICGAKTYGCSLAQWDNVQDLNNIMSADESARFDGQCGLRVTLAGAYTAFVEDTTPGAAFPDVTEYTARFYMYVGEMTFGAGDYAELFAGYDGGSELVFSMSIYEANGFLYTHLVLVDDFGSPIETGNNGILLKRGWRSIELKWRAASSNGANDGELTVSIDGIPGSGAEILTGLDNDTRNLSRVRLGVLSGNTSSISGALDLDLFQSGRGGTFGPIAKACVGTDVDLRNVTFLPGAADCRGGNSMYLGPRVTIDEGADLHLTAPIVTISDLSVARGAILRISSPGIP